MADIVDELEKRRQQYPERFPKPVYVLAAVDDNVEGEWERRLQEAKENTTGECIILIPYKTGESHWIGVLLTFNTREQIERAEFIVPVKRSTFTPEKMQRQFTSVYSGVILTSKNLQKHDDEKQSGTLTTENLLKATEEAQSVDAKYNDTDGSLEQTSTDRNTLSVSTRTNLRSPPMSTTFPGKTTDFYNSEQTQSSESDSPENQDPIILAAEVLGTEQPIAHENRPDQSCELLKEQLKSRLVDHDISDAKELEQRIAEKKQVIQSLNESGRNKIAQRRQDSLTELEQIQALVDEIKAIESLQSEEEYETLKRQLDEGLAKMDIASKADLKQLIIQKKEEIDSLKVKGKPNNVLRRQTSLAELEQLQLLADRMDAVESLRSNDEDYNDLKQQVEQGFTQHDISSKEELCQRIINKKEDIQSLTIQKKPQLVRKRQSSLTELEQLQLLVDKLETITPSKPIIEQSVIEQPENEQRQIEQPGMEQPEIEQPSKIVDECLVTEENLKNMYEDFRSMPLCSERSIIRLLYYVSLQLADDPTSLDDTIKASSQIETEIIKELECLKERLKTEELLSAEIQNSVEKCFIHLRDKNWRATVIVLRTMFKQLSPLDMRELVRLIEKVEDAAQLIKGNDIILLLGGTGSGKSTTIHFLAGSKMVETEVNGLNHITYTKIINPALEKVTTSPFARSETRHITPVTVNFKDVKVYTNGSIILCDSPGFEDTNGAEVDIANGISIIKAIRGCQSVRPVVLISYKGIGDRGDGVKRLTYMLSGLIPQVKDHLRTFSNIFTKFPDKERDKIHSLLNDINDNLNEEEKLDVSFTTFLKDILDKTGDSAKILDPVNDCPGPLLNKLATSAVIKHPEEVFHFSIAEKSKAILQEQMRKNQLSVISATKRSEYLLIKYKLDQLKCLNDLLQQDYIRQIYDESVRYVNKHLVEEYQAGISMINRCLINQTIVSSEDVQTYQKCIDNAQCAEELRKEHLGKEAIHSAAFIQYLNQQIDRLLEDLREKEISDLSVKVTLNKIQLLSKSFPDLDSNKYKNICQGFTEKFDAVAKSFQTSVRSNQFDESAMNLLKISDGSTILCGHLNSGDMKSKYLELKEYFLKYLNDSSEKVSYIFSLEKVGKNDVESLKSWVCMLESAKNTFALEPHISKQAINEVYENLLLKILNYVNEIIRKIDTQHKNENSFHVLEQYMQEIDLFRTISVIEHRTAQSYYSTLEKLVGYIHESRRVVEEQLGILFRAEGKVDYYKLTKYLSSLQGAKWIEKYRNGAYTDVMNDVKQQFIQHIKTLRECIMEVNLDLDNFDKITSVYKMVSEINEMKPIEKIFEDVSEYIKEVNDWFVTVVNNVFAIIKDTFSAAKLKEQECQTLDFSKVEKAFLYLDKCKNIPLLVKSNCLAVLNDLEKFVRRYCDSVQKQMTSCFDYIKQFQNQNQEELSKKARMLGTRLQEVSELTTTYSRSFSCFSNKKIVKEWQNELSSYFTELTDEMDKMRATQRTEALSIKLLLVKALSVIDSFMVSEKYIDLYHKYQTIFYDETDKIGEKVIDATKKYEYEQVAVEMVALQSSSEVGKHFFNQAKRALNVGVECLMEETQNKATMLGNNIEIEGITFIVENLKRLQRAKHFVSQFLDPKHNIEKCTTQVKKLVEEGINRFLEGVETLIIINNFSEADKKIDSVTSVRTLLGNYCTQEASKKIDALKQLQSKVVLEDVVSKYSDMDISGYTLNPPTDIFKKLGVVNNTNPIYHQSLNTIKERIFAKFRQELEQAKSNLLPNLQNPHIRKFESAVKYLPDMMKNALEVELKHCKDDIALLIKDTENNLDKAFTSEDPTNIKSALEKYQSWEGMKSYMTKGRELVLKQVQPIFLKIIRNFEKDEIIEALGNVEKLFDYKRDLEKVVTEIRQLCSEVRNRIKTTFDAAHLHFTNRFLNNNMSDASTEISEAVEKSFICLIEFMKFNYEHKGQPILIDMFPGDFNQKLTVLNENIFKYFIERQKKIETAMQTVDVSSLKTSLDDLNRWNSLFMKMKNYDNMHHINDFSMSDTVKAINDLVPYRKMLEAVSLKIQELVDELINQELINSETKALSQPRNEFYRKLNEKYLILHKAKLFDTYGMNININKAEEECFASLERKISDIFSTADSVVEKFSSDSPLMQQDYDSFGIHYNNLLSFQQEMKVKNGEVHKNIETIRNKVLHKIEIWGKAAGNETILENIAANLISMKRASADMPSFGAEINMEIDKAINHCKTRTNCPINFGKLGIVLDQDRTGVGSRIIAEHQAFKGFALSLFNEKTQKHDVEYVLEKLDGTLINKKKLKERYDEFLSIYKKLIKQHLKTKLVLDLLISETISIKGDFKLKSDQPVWDASIRAEIPRLAAHVFALWTLKNASHYFEAEGVEKRDNYLMQPHPAQVISVFRMLGIGDTTEELENNLVQIGTGEGKSVTLGATAAILALLGFDVRCACYSEYLSQRDHTAFSPLFDSLSLSHNIHYDTFNQLCEDMINNSGDIRRKVEQLTSTGSGDSSQNKQQTRRPTILLIDEVDVFFSQDFYGNVYTPSASLRDPTITSLIDFIWKERTSKLNLKTVKLTDEYKACCGRFPAWESLIQEAIKDMLSDVKSFESHDYVVNQDKIGYIEQDNVVYNVGYGYKTLFAYYCEHGKGKISKESLEQNLSIGIKCGSFSYAEIPHEFKFIMGVTGTLKILSDPEKAIIRGVYKISKRTYTPSVFGKNSLSFIKRDDVMIETGDDYFNTIKREIDDRLIGRSSHKRAVLVIFESKQKLKEFYNSKALEPIKDSVIFLTEEGSSKEKENLIRRATVSGQITLFTRTFGRGTDFICHDQIVSAAGGVHVIQTFLSENVSEEVQIKGRTARQGDKGSYSMILLDRDLERFQIEREDIEDIKTGKGIATRLVDVLSLKKTYDTVYDLLDDKRIVLFKTQYEANMEYVKQAKEKHLAAKGFLNNLNFGEVNSVKQFLIKVNKGTENDGSSRTVCLMDGTSSMTHLLHKCKTTVEVMVERASKVLTDNNISSNAFQIQLVVYRNYNSPEDKILQTSPWETKPDNLRAFMNTIEVAGGWSNEAIEIGLWHANKENERKPITQVILIGDAAPNLKDEVEEKRKRSGENYWKTTKFPAPTYYEDELKKLIQNKIPVHAFYVEAKAEASFEKIASETGGRCELLDINSSSGAETLTRLVTEEILRNVGGSSKGNDLVEAYRKSYT